MAAAPKTPAECKAAGYAAAQCLDALGPAATGLKTSGYSEKECKAAGFGKCPYCKGEGTLFTLFGLATATTTFGVFFAEAFVAFGSEFATGVGTSTICVVFMGETFGTVSVFLAAALGAARGTAVFGNADGGFSVIKATLFGGLGGGLGGGFGAKNATLLGATLCGLGGGLGGLAGLAFATTTVAGLGAKFTAALSGGLAALGFAIATVGVVVPFALTGRTCINCGGDGRRILLGAVAGSGLRYWN